MIDPAPTLARRLGSTTHRSLLLHVAAALGVGNSALLAALAAHRGCRYYAVPACDPVAMPGLADFPNEELAIALLHPALPWDPQRIRVGAAMLSAAGADPRRLARLAVRERCQAIVRHIAQAGARFEPQNLFWTELLARLGEATPPPPGVLPHPTRFVAATGFSATGRRGVHATWVRPSPAPAAA